MKFAEIRNQRIRRVGLVESNDARKTREQEHEYKTYEALPHDEEVAAIDSTRLAETFIQGLSLQDEGKITVERWHEEQFSKYIEKVVFNTTISGEWHDYGRKHREKMGTVYPLFSRANIKNLPSIQKSAA